MKKKYKDYLFLSIIMIIIFGLVFVLKGIFPFGDNSLVYSDLKVQITSFLYHLWDSIRGNESLLITHNLASSSSFLVNMNYYITSPFSLLVLLVQRCDIYKMVSVIMILKCMLSGITFMFVLKKLFKNLDSYSTIALSLLYAISGYFLVFGQIIAWMEITYLLPLIIYGLINMFDGKKGTLYYVTLTISLICCFYTSVLLLIFIFLISFIYLWMFKKENIKSCVAALGINTIFSVLTAACSLIPSYLGLSFTHRSEFSLENVFSAEIGFILDKIHIIMVNGILILLSLLLLFQYKKFKKEIKFFFITAVILLIPVLIEPINRIIHLGSYYGFPCRYGFLIMITLALGSAFYLNNCEPRKIKRTSLVSIIAVVVLTLLTIFLFIKKGYLFEIALSKLNFFKSPNGFLFASIIMVLIMIITFIILLMFNSKYRNKLLLLIAIIFSFMYSYTYLGIDSSFKETKDSFNDFELLYNYDLDKLYKVKVDDIDYGYNIGEFTGIGSDFSFSSLNTKTNIAVMNGLGYCYKAGFLNLYNGTLFSDILLGNKYLLTKYDLEEKTYIKKDIDLQTYKLYELKQDIPFGYILDNNVELTNNVFESQNNIFKSMTGIDNLFDIETLEKNTNYINTYEVKGTHTLYLYIDRNLELTSIVNPYKSYEIYVNNELYVRDSIKGYNVPGILSLGTYTDSNVVVEIKIIDEEKSKKDIIYFASMNDSLLKEIKQNNIKVDYNKSDIHITYNANVDEKGKILYVPISYLNGMSIELNHKKIDGIKMFDEYLGIPLEEGENNIKVSYSVPGLKIGLIISILAIICFIIINKFSTYIVNNKWFGNFCYYAYLIGFILVAFIIFLLPILVVVFKVIF